VNPRSRVGRGASGGDESGKLKAPKSRGQQAALKVPQGQAVDLKAPQGQAADPKALQDQVAGLKAPQGRSVGPKGPEGQEGVEGAIHYVLNGEIVS
jgi:hypothetical protein